MKLPSLKEIVLAASLALLPAILSAKEYRFMKYKIETFFGINVGTVSFEELNGYIYSKIDIEDWLTLVTFGKLRDRVYKTINENNKTLYLEHGETKSLEGSVKGKDVLSRALELQRYFENGNISESPLVTDSCMDLYVDSTLHKVRLIEYKDIEVKEKKRGKIKAKKISITGCPDNQTFIDLTVYDGRVSHLNVDLRKLNLKLSAKLVEYKLEIEED